MKASLLLSLSLILFAACNPATKEAPSDPILIPNLIKNFENQLSTLDTKEISSLDQATKLFQDHVVQTNNLSQRDSLFPPYFNFYNLGRNLLIGESDATINQYGFSKHQRNAKEFLLPSSPGYLEKNVIHYFSPPMQKFCKQQLKEFNDVQSLNTFARNAIWWETFNQENPDFFLKPMTSYHYKNWHLKNLLAGTNTIKVFTQENLLSEEANKTYQTLLKDHANSQTANTVRTYLELLNKNNKTKTPEVVDFLNQFN